MNDRELVSYLRRCNSEDNHAYADVAHRFGADALLDSHLPMLDQIDLLAQEWQVMDPTDKRHAGLTYALRVIAEAYLQHPG